MIRVDLNWPITPEDHDRWVNYSGRGKVVQLSSNTFEFRSNTRQEIMDWLYEQDPDAVLSDHNAFVARITFRHNADAALFKLIWGGIRV